MITPEIIEAHGLTPEEYDRICKTLQREPNLTELGMFSVMWSEHCSYKSSRVHLKRLPTKGPMVLQGPGENAGVIDLEILSQVLTHDHSPRLRELQVVFFFALCAGARDNHGEPERIALQISADLIQQLFFAQLRGVRFAEEVAAREAELA